MFKGSQFEELEARLSESRNKFHPTQSFVVGSGGIPIDEFLSWDMGRLLDT